MRDIPCFTTGHGVAALSLREIPVRGEAYIHLLQSQQPLALLEECVSFCRACGAVRVFAAEHDSLLGRPSYSTVLRMQGTIAPGETACLWPVTAENVGHWRQLYNEKMAPVDHATTLTAADEARILSDGGAYFIHRQDTLLGIGWISGGTLLALAAMQPGSGAVVLRTLAGLYPGQALELEVASTNRRALRLYERMGLIPTREVKKWYCVYGG